MPSDSLLAPCQVILGSERLGGTLRLEGAVAQVKGTGQMRGRLWPRFTIFLGKKLNLPIEGSNP